MRRVTNTNLLFWVNLPKPSLTEHFLQGNVPLRHLLNAKPPFISWRRSAFNEVNDCTLKKISFKTHYLFQIYIGLDVSFNNLKYLPRSTFEYLIHIEEINLSGNIFFQIHDSATSASIGSLSSLIQLNMSTMNIDMVPKHFMKSLGKLKKLDLSHNKLPEV